MNSPYPAAIITQAKHIKLLICDVDGVLSDGTITIDDQGTESKGFHVHDGLGLKMLQQANIDVAIISSRDTQSVQQRMQALGIKHVFQGIKNKMDCYQRLLTQLSLTHEQIAYVGDDLPDLAVMQQVGLSVAVANANAFVKQHAHWQTTLTGGQGAVREVCDLILSAQQQLAPLLESYLT